MVSGSAGVSHPHISKRLLGFSMCVPTKINTGKGKDIEPKESLELVAQNLILHES